MMAAIRADARDGDIDPSDVWLMRAAGGDDESDDNFPSLLQTQDDDQFSFEDSERFEEDSLCSWMSDAESLNQNWRGWSVARNSTTTSGDQNFNDGSVLAFPLSSLRYTGGISSSLQSQHSRHSVCNSSANLPQSGSPTMSVNCTIVNTGVSMRNLAEMSARIVARNYSFLALESSYHAISAARRRTSLMNNENNTDPIIAFSDAYAKNASIPDKFFLSIVKWCFPESEEDIRLYSCLANGNADEFGRGEYLYQTNAVHDVIQIGYHISAVINSASTSAMPSSAGTPGPTYRFTKMTYNVSVRVDRCRIVSCSCSCAYKASWCQHVVAVCLYRINRCNNVEYRVTIWDSINELSNEKLKKLAQFLVNELPRQYLPIAQRLIDHLRDPNSEINAAVGAPDPTDGGHDEVAIWCLDQRTLHENIHRILAKFCIPSPTVHCDVQYLSSNQPPAASEWQSLLRAHRSKEPEGLWNLLSIVREMFRRRDENATSLLHIITEEMLANSQVLIWWYQTALSQSGQWSLCPPPGNKSSSLMSNQKTPQLNCASLCDEVVQLWRFAALNPRLTEIERDQLGNFIQLYHRNAVSRIWKILCSMANSEASTQNQPNNAIVSVIDRNGERLSIKNARFTADVFPGFLRALKACQIGWFGINVRGIKNVNSVNVTKDKFSCTLMSPNLPLLRQAFKTREDSPSSEIRSFMSPNASYALQASRKKRKKITRSTHRHLHTFEFHDERSLFRAVRTAANAAREEILGEELEDDSGESGQESESGPSSSQKANLLQQDDNDIKAKGADAVATNEMKFPSNDVDELFAFAHIQQSNWDVKFARCEALMSHGYTHTACEMAVELAEEMLRRPPNLLMLSFDQRYSPEIAYMYQRFRRRKLSQCSYLSESSLFDINIQLLDKSQLAENIFIRTLFLVQTLMKEPKTHRLAFSLALTVLELPRNPAATKFLEVKLYYLETELVALLRKIEIGHAELRLIRELARNFIISGATLPTSLQPRVLPLALGQYILDALSYTHNYTQGRRSNSGIITKCKVPRFISDEDLAIKVALEALGMKLMVSEADFPMLCENVRRQRGELALTMLVRYKDCDDKLALVIDKLLDPTMHRMYKDSQTNAIVLLSTNSDYMNNFYGKRPNFEMLQNFKDCPDDVASDHLEIFDNSGLSYKVDRENDVSNQFSYRLMQMNHESADVLPFNVLTSRRRSSDESSASLPDGCSTFVMPHEVAENNQSFSMCPSNSSSPARRFSSALTFENAGDMNLSSSNNDYNQFYRPNRRKLIPNLPNQASEAQAHYMMELAKRLLVEAGGSQSTVIFNVSHNIGSQSNAQHSGPHRQLHMCSFLIGLYALGLNNLLSPSWQTRTYSTNVSWIHGQAIEIGCAAISVVERVWESHLTPTEVAALADKASQSRDVYMVEAGAKLALSVLPKAYALTAAESQKALNQCKEQSFEMLEKACRAVEKAAEKDGVYPEVLFKVARHWYDLYLLVEPASNGQVVANHSPNLLQAHGSSLFSNVMPSILPDTAQQNFITSSKPIPMQIPVQCNVMQRHQVPYMTHSYFMQTCSTQTHLPPPNFLPSVSCSQQMIYPQPCGPGALPTIQQTSPPVHSVYQPKSNVFVPPLANATQARALHASHSAPNLSPMQVAQISRRNQQTLAALPSTAFMPSVQHQFHPTSDQLLPTVGLINEPGTMGAPIHHAPPPPNSVMLCSNVGLPTTYYAQQSPQSQLPASNISLPSPTAQITGDPNMAKLVHAHRVGMIAMETMGSRNLDDNRSYTKFSQNPAYADDVHWLFSVASRLGGVFVQSFCEVAARSVASPFVLFALAVESTKVFQWQVPAMSYHSQALLHTSRSHISGSVPNVRTLMLQHGFSSATSELMQHCIEMFYAAASSKLSHPRFVPSDIEEVLQLVKAAKEGFHWMPGQGKIMFDDFMRHVRKQKAFKKEVAQRINASLSSSSSS